MVPLTCAPINGGDSAAVQQRNYRPWAGWNCTLGGVHFTHRGPGWATTYSQGTQRTHRGKMWRPQ